MTKTKDIRNRNLLFLQSHGIRSLAGIDIEDICGGEEDVTRPGECLPPGGPKEKKDDQV